LNESDIPLTTAELRQALLGKLQVHLDNSEWRDAISVTAFMRAVDTKLRCETDPGYPQDPERRLEELHAQAAFFREYIRMRLRDDDLHAVMDACADLMELETEGACIERAATEKANES
jgi:hypothetical protein